MKKILKRQEGRLCSIKGGEWGGVVKRGGVNKCWDIRTGTMVSKNWLTIQKCVKSSFYLLLC